MSLKSFDKFCENMILAEPFFKKRSCNNRVRHGGIGFGNAHYCLYGADTRSPQKEKAVHR